MRLWWRMIRPCDFVMVSVLRSPRFLIAGVSVFRGRFLLSPSFPRRFPAPVVVCDSLELTLGAPQRVTDYRISFRSFDSLLFCSGHLGFRRGPFYWRFAPLSDLPSDGIPSARVIYLSGYSAVISAFELPNSSVAYPSSIAFFGGDARRHCPRP